MAIDIFLVIPTPPTGAIKPPPLAGDPVQDQYFKQTYGNAAAVVPLQSFSLSAENPTTIGSMSGGAGAGKAKFNPLVVQKAVDRLTPSLFAISASGLHFDKIQIYVRKAGGGGPQPGKPYLAYEFSMVFITDMAWGESSGDDAPAEQVTFVYGALALGYYPQKPDGSFGTPLKLGWSVVTNEATGADTLNNF